MIERFEALGLTNYEARALCHLVEHGDRTGPDLSRETGIPMGRVYDTLNVLVERGVAVTRGGRPRVFSCAPLAAIPGRLMAHSKRRLQVLEKGIEQHAAVLEEALSQLAPAAVGATGHGLRLGEQAAREFLVEATHAARGDVIAYLAFASIQDDDLQIFDAFRGAVIRGVHTRVLLRERDVDYLMATPYVAAVLDAMLPHLGATLQVRLTGDDSIPFSVLDSERVVIGVQNPVLPDRYFAVVHVDDATFAAQLRERFDDLWHTADLDTGLMQRVLKRLEKEGDSRTARFLESMVRRRVQKAAKRAR